MAGAEPVYLVGGAVRDLLLQRRLHDLDFAAANGVRAMARRTADELNGAFFMMDEERETARVVLQGVPYDGLILDFTRYRAGDLSGDLRGRDFTVNAMALDLAFLDRLIDPLGGAADLHEKRLRLCTPQALIDDPARTLRGLRIAVDCQLRILPETAHALREAAPFLERVSAERKRDELFNILDGPRLPAALRLLQQFNLLQGVLPELPPLVGEPQRAPHIDDVWEHTLALISELDRLLDLLACDPPAADASANLLTGLAALRLGRFRPQLTALMSAPLTAARPRRALLFLGALYHDAAKPQSRTYGPDGRMHFYEHDALGAESMAARASALALSQEEIHYLTLLVRRHMRIHFLLKREQTLTRRLIYRYFRDLGEVGVDVCLHSLADLLATQGPALPPEQWTGELDICRALLEAWYEQPAQVISPPRLLNGHDLMAELKLEPGPRLGELLEAVREAQACGELSTREEALAYARTIMEQQGL